jgi:phage/plasmid-like protein (TIGR03299 family)
MAHEIFGNRFYTYEQPAWHKLGEVGQEKEGAVKVYKRFAPVTIGTQPVYIQNEDGTYEAVDSFRAIVREAGDDYTREVFNIVSAGYEIVTPLEICKLWDARVGRHVETLGVLKGGRLMFISAKLPAFDVRGDECENYLLLTAPYSGTAGHEIMMTPRRVVCNNTLILGRREASEAYMVPHHEGSTQVLGDWLEAVATTAEARAEAMREVFELLAATTLAKKQIAPVLTEVYPDLKVPSSAATAEATKARMERFERQREWAPKRRQAVVALYEGGGLGSDTQAAKGTAWGLYNAVCEMEDRRPGLRENDAASDAVFGSRAQNKAVAFDALVQLARGAGAKAAKVAAAAK